jgi:hypothetical protein
MLHVPFKGAGPATIDVVGGHTSLMFGGCSRPRRRCAQGSCAHRHGLAQAQPDLPGRAVDRGSRRPGYETVNWFGWSHPPERRRRSSSGCTARSRWYKDLPEVQKQFDADGATIIRMTPAEFGDYMVADMSKWERGREGRQASRRSDLESRCRTRGSLLLKVAAVLLALTTAAPRTGLSEPSRCGSSFRSRPAPYNDIVARLVATHLSTRLGRQVIVENRAGAGASSPPRQWRTRRRTGHTLLLVSSSITVLPAMQPLHTTPSSRSRRSPCLPRRRTYVTGIPRWRPIRSRN